MRPGSSTESYLAFARIGLWENPGKNLNQVTCPDRDSNPGHLVSRPDALTVTPQNSQDPVLQQVYHKLLKPNENQFPATDIEGFRSVCKESKYAFISSSFKYRKLTKEFLCEILEVPGACYAMALDTINTGVHARLVKENPPKTTELSEDSDVGATMGDTFIIFLLLRDEVTGEWRKLHNTELHALYSSPDIIRNIKSRRLRWAGHAARMGESRNAYSVLVGRPEGKRPLGRPRRRWEDNITMDLREVGYDDRDWINIAQDRDRWRAYVRAAMNLRVP
ncbi:hypothetical protein ANN_20908 [Periplaneta americana]|uniref:Uncharacterized protein n=1 Tax=Periplaneta americana TaxID=6978 RepID=A0ABQ8SEN3_PERAM|nr:hypothetical protein ANN_20908 [Periplaneta americana]